MRRKTSHKETDCVRHAPMDAATADTFGLVANRTIRGDFQVIFDALQLSDALSNATVDLLRIIDDRIQPTLIVSTRENFTMRSPGQSDQHLAAPGDELKPSCRESGHWPANRMATRRRQ